MTAVTIVHLVGLWTQENCKKTRESRVRAPAPDALDSSEKEGTVVRKY